MDEISFSEMDDSSAYALEVEEAATLLGVSRTRLSQLTSKGVLSYQRRKIQTRNRLFYKRSEIVGYLRRQMGASAHDTPGVQSPFFEPPGGTSASSLSKQEEPASLSRTPFLRNRTAKADSRPLSSASALQHQRYEESRISALQRELAAVPNLFEGQNDVLSSLQQRMRESLMRIARLETMLQRKDNRSPLQSNIAATAEETPVRRPRIKSMKLRNAARVRVRI